MYTIVINQKALTLNYWIEKHILRPLFLTFVHLSPQVLIHIINICIRSSCTHKKIPPPQKT